jgi:hypothetical protein
MRLPPLLSGEKGAPEDAMRFRIVSFDVRCCCCSMAKTIATMNVTVLENNCNDHKLKKSRIRLVKSCFIRAGTLRSDILLRVIDHMFARAEDGVLKRIQRREGFNGLMVEDFAALAACFRMSGNCRA